MKIRKRDVPKEVEIAPGVFYKILWKRDLLKQGFCGLTYFDPKEIHIAMGMDIEETIATLWHEIQHAISHEWEFELKHPLINKLEEPLAFFHARNSVWIAWR